MFFIRGNLGLELYVGNHSGAHADIDVSSARRSFRHQRTDLAEAERVLEIDKERTCERSNTLATYPLIYYLVAYIPRYGEPVRWILFLLAGGAVWGWIRGGPRVPQPRS